MGTEVNDVVAFYEGGAEDPRLASGIGLLEFARTQELLRQRLPRPPARVLDVGGGPGRYAAWLAASGYEVTLVDPVPLHVEQARGRATNQTYEALIGEARSLPFRDHIFDAVLMFGPLYHLLEAEERLAAWAEAVRVARPGAVIAASAIARFSALLDGIRTSWITDLEHLTRVISRAETGRYPEAIGSAYLHRPEELRAEAERAGLADVHVLPIEGPFWLLPDVDVRANDPAAWDLLLATVSAIESEPALLGASNHLFVSGYAP